MWDSWNSGKTKIYLFRFIPFLPLCTRKIYRTIRVRKREMGNSGALRWGRIVWVLRYHSLTVIIFGFPQFKYLAKMSWPSTETPLLLIKWFCWDICTKLNITYQSHWSDIIVFYIQLFFVFLRRVHLCEDCSGFEETITESCLQNFNSFHRLLDWVSTACFMICSREVCRI